MSLENSGLRLNHLLLAVLASEMQRGMVVELELEEGALLHHLRGLMEEVLVELELEPELEPELVYVEPSSRGEGLLSWAYLCTLGVSHASYLYDGGPDGLDHGGGLDRGHPYHRGRGRAHAPCEFSEIAPPIHQSHFWIIL